MNNQNNYELYHHGIPGMKWGIRRYQNKDGSLTPAGRKRAAKLEKQYNSLTGKKLNNQSNQSKQSNKPKTINDMSDSELREKTNRIRLENEYVREVNTYKTLHPQKVSLGRKFASHVGKNIILPTATEAGKKYLSEYLTTKVGNNKVNKSDEWAKLAKDYENRKKIEEGQKYFKEGKYKD